MNPKVEGNLGANNEPLGQELSDHWAFEEEDDLFLADICCEWMQGDVAYLSGGGSAFNYPVTMPVVGLI